MYVPVLVSNIVQSKFELSLASRIIIGEISSVDTAEYGKLWVNGGELAYIQYDVMINDYIRHIIQGYKELHMTRFWIRFYCTPESVDDFVVLGSLFDDPNLRLIELSTVNNTFNYFTKDQLPNMAYEPEGHNIVDDFKQGPMTMAGDTMSILLEYSADAWNYISQGGGINIGG